jgi:adenosylcobinamide-GDP ribazoletransferase
VKGITERNLLSRPRTELRAVAAALTFLTSIPLGRWLVLDGGDVARAGSAFPLVGGVVGAAVGGIANALTGSLSSALAAGFALAAGVLLTGALHLDGLADTADALGGGSRARALEIMRDHATGAYGTAAIVLDLAVKGIALAALAQHGKALSFAVAAGALSRMIPVLLVAILPYARPGPGKAASFTRTGGRRVIPAAAIAVALTVAAVGADGLLLVAGAAAVAVTLGMALRRWLGGVTGDTLGAAVELSEATVLVVAAALVRAG